MSEPGDLDRIAELEKQVAARDAEIADLKHKVEELTQLVMSLKEELGRNSRNSHLPPSSDGPGARPPAEKRPGGAQRKRGGQPGHTGHKRDLLPANQVDEFVELYPKHCENCWAPLPHVRDENATRYQVTEMPPVRPHTTEFRCNGVTCGCGHTTYAKTEGVVPSSPFGPRLMALIALLTGVYHLSRRKAGTLLRDVLGVQLSLGALSAVEGRVSGAVEWPVVEVWCRLEDNEVKHADATTWLLGGKLRALWTIATKALTVFKILVDGAADTVTPFFGACTGILVSDRAAVFSFWSMKARQICWAHLLRKAVSFSERDGPAGAFGREMLDYIGIIFQHWDDVKAGKLSRDNFRVLMAPVRKQVEAMLERAVAAKLPDVSGSCADILEHREALWTFVDREDVEPTNNHAERETQSVCPLEKALLRRPERARQPFRGAAHDRGPHRSQAEQERAGIPDRLLRRGPRRLDAAVAVRRRLNSGRLRRCHREVTREVALTRAAHAARALEVQHRPIQHPRLLADPRCNDGHRLARARPHCLE